MNIVNDKMPQFKRSLYNVLDDAFREGARDTLINAKQNAPFDKGGLRSETEVSKPGILHYRVSFWKEYARYQEFGGDDNRTVRNYSTAGTGKAYLKTAGDKEATKLVMTIKKHIPRVRV